MLLQLFVKVERLIHAWRGSDIRYILIIFSFLVLIILTFINILLTSKLEILINHKIPTELSELIIILFSQVLHFHFNWTRTLLKSLNIFSFQNKGLIMSQTHFPIKFLRQITSIRVIKQIHLTHMIMAVQETVLNRFISAACSLLFGLWVEIVLDVLACDLVAVTVYCDLWDSAQFALDLDTMETDWILCATHG